MNKKALTLFTLVFVACLPGISQALVFSETLSLNKTLCGLYAWTYQHSTPADFEVPYDDLNRASLKIEAKNVSAGLPGIENDSVWAECFLQGTLNTESGHWTWLGYKVDDPYSTTAFNLDNLIDVFALGWDAGDPLNITVAGCEGFGSLTLLSSTLTLDYNNQSAPVPEPATLLLLGSGLAGLAGLRRKKQQ